MLGFADVINALSATSGVSPGGGVTWECAVVATSGNTDAMRLRKDDRSFTSPNLAVRREREKPKEAHLRTVNVSPYAPEASNHMTEPAPPTTEQTLWSGTV